EIRPRSVQFIKNGDALIVGYLDHGIRCWNLETQQISWCLPTRSTRIGRLSTSPNSRIVAASNLYDGVDIYDVQERTHLRTIKIDMKDNIPLPVVFLGDDTLLIGTACGEVHI
ncbi:hypothetical protein C8Q79DRAFT_887086, partial [Trametes meyenii]